MNLEEKLRALKKASRPSARDAELGRQLEYLSRMDGAVKKLPAQRFPQGIEHYVDGSVEANARGDYFLASQRLPFGRPYGKIRIGDISTADLSPLAIFLPAGPLPEAARFVYLDTETTGLAGGTGTCAFLIGIGTIEGKQFAVRQFFLRDYPEEKAVLAALTEALEPFDGLAHALQAIATLLVMCDARDLGVSVGENEAERSQESEVRNQNPDEEGNRVPSFGRRLATLFEPNIYLYDKYPGGVGFSEPLFRLSESLLENTRRLIENCPCPSGCPSCVGPAGDVGEKGKEVALAILRGLQVGSRK